MVPCVQGFSEGAVHSDAWRNIFRDVSSWGWGSGKETMEREALERRRGLPAVGQEGAGRGLAVPFSGSCHRDAKTQLAGAQEL